MRGNKEEHLIPLIKDDTALFYSYEKSSSPKEIGLLCDEQGNLTNDESSMAMLISNQFRKMWSTP